MTLKTVYKLGVKPLPLGHDQLVLPDPNTEPGLIHIPDTL